MNVIGVWYEGKKEMKTVGIYVRVFLLRRL